MTGQLLTAGQLAERWQVPTSHVYRLAREGRIPVVELGRYRRFHPAAIEEFERATAATDTVGSPANGRGDAAGSLARPGESYLHEHPAE